MAEFFHAPLSDDFFARCAEVLLARYHVKANPFALTELIIWVPSSRMADSLAESLMEKAGGGVLLPDIRPMGTETDDLLLDDMLFEGGAMSAFERLMFLTDYAMKHMPHAQWTKALNLAKHLDTLWKKMLLNGVEMEGLLEAVPEEWQEKWDDIGDILKGLTEAYPAHLKAYHLKDETLRKLDVLKAYTTQYQARGVTAPTWVLGFSDTIPPAAEMLQALATCENAHFVMPLDVQGVKTVCAAGNLLPTHPLYGMQNFVRSWGLSESTLQLLPDSTAGESFLPLFDANPRCENHQVAALTLCEAQHLESEAETIAWLMAEQAMQPHKTCALVTADLGLAFRVQEVLESYGLLVDRTNSAPFMSSPVGRLALQVLDVQLSSFKPEKFAHILLDPITNGGLSPQLVGVLDKKVLRDPENTTSSLAFWVNTFNTYAEKNEADVSGVLNLLAAYQSFDISKSRPLSAWLKSHLNLLIELTSSSAGRGFLNREEEALLAWQKMIAQTEHMGSLLSFKDYAERFHVLFESVALPNRTEGAHPRLKILGPLESRLQRYDCVILGGLNEGVTPGRSSVDVFLSYEQRQKLGLPPVESAIGLSAHDFLSQLYADEVVLTRRLQGDDGKTMPSRFLMRLKSALGADVYARLLSAGALVVEAAEARRLAVGVSHHNQPAQVRVLADSAPRYWSPSYVKDLMACPFKAYVRKGLKVDAFEPYAKSPDAALRGTLIHEVLALFCLKRRYLELSERDTYVAELMQDASALFARRLPPAVQAVWQTRFEKLAPDIIDFWLSRQEEGWHQHALEQDTKSDKTPVPIFAVLDRVDGSASGDMSILDYKTGSLPSEKDMLTGAQPQLAMEALVWLAEHPDAHVVELVYFRLPAGSRKGAEKKVMVQGEEKMQTLLTHTEDGLTRLKNTYQGANKTWPAVAGGASAVQLEGACAMCDYSGLCRVKEWVSAQGKQGAEV